MPSLQDNIFELNKYKKGDIIPNPDVRIVVLIDENIQITRRSLAHILQKGEIGVLLAGVLEKCILFPDAIFLSDKMQSMKTARYILFKRNALPERSVAVVVEQEELRNYILIITAMIADEKYLLRKYKKLR